MFSLFNIRTFPSSAALAEKNQGTVLAVNRLVWPKPTVNKFKTMKVHNKTICPESTPREN